MIKRILLVSCVSVLAIVWVLYYQTSGYEIESDEKSIDQAIESLINQTNKEKQQIDIRTSKDIANKKVVLFSIGEKLGDSEFTEGRNGKYKIESAGHGTNWVLERVIHTNEGTYYRVAGKKDNIGRIKAFISENVCDIQIPEQEYYIEFCELNEEVVQAFSDGMVIYDIEGKEITRVNISEEQIIN